MESRLRSGELARVKTIQWTIRWTLACLGMWGSVHAQDRVHLFPDDQLVFRDMVAHVEHNVVRLGPSWSGEVAYTLLADNMWEETHLHLGYSTSALDIAYTVGEGKLCLGDSRFSDGILYTYHDGSIFIGDSTFPLDVAYTLREEVPAFPSPSGAPVWGIYKEDSRSWTDRVAVMEGLASPAQIFGLLAAAGLL